MKLQPANLPDNPLGTAERLFRRLAAERLDALEDARLRYAGGLVPQGALTDIGTIAHKIAGTAATLGHPQLGHLAHIVEGLVATGASGPDIIDALDRLTAALDDLCP